MMRHENGHNENHDVFFVSFVVIKSRRKGLMILLSTDYKKIHNNNLYMYPKKTLFFSY